ncbi:MAG TPA: GNAT family N-acetyltransferase [Burkholderiales bacterium]|nr:GNAT family N-acetyltransferase [Burkholderiales bacterium]
MPAPSIALRPMTPGEFQRYLKPAIRGYAQMHIRAGDVEPKQALRRAKADYAQLLPKGLATPGHHLYTITLADNGKPIGMAWFELKQRHGKRKAFIFDFAINKAQRGKGFGGQSMSAIEQQAKVLGAVTVDLHVFGHNLAARGLYEKCGYRYTGMHMSKDLY